MFRAVRESSAFGAALALAIGVAAGWFLAGGEPSDKAVARESWLFSHTADAATIVAGDGGSLTITLNGVDSHVVMFADRPYRDARVVGAPKFYGKWADVFGSSAPNAVLVEHSPRGETDSLVVTIASARLAADQLVIQAKLLEAENIPPSLRSLVGGVHKSTPAKVMDVSIFIDSSDLSLDSTGTASQSVADVLGLSPTEARRCASAVTMTSAVTADDIAACVDSEVTMNYECAAPPEVTIVYMGSSKFALREGLLPVQLQDGSTSDQLLALCA